MKKIIFGILLLAATTNGFAQKYQARSGKVSFFSSTPIENIEAMNNEAACMLDSKAGDFVFVVPIKSFKFEKALMQDHFNEDYMESDKFPKSDFKGKISNIGDVNFSKDGVYKVTAVGKLTMHGVTQDVTIPGEIVIKGKQATTNAKFKVKAASYGINIPINGKIAKEMEVTVNAVLDQK
jgi:polyisoprenoid-binding protein YceI